LRQLNILILSDYLPHRKNKSHAPYNKDYQKQRNGKGNESVFKQGGVPVVLLILEHI
jgi:hypothetical protein